MEAVILCYDVPVEEITEGRGVVPNYHLKVIKRLEGAGKVRRLQKSVLLIEDPVALYFVKDALERVGARYLVIEGRIRSEGGVHHESEREGML